VLTKLRHSRPVGLIRYHLYRDVLLARPKRHACNICGWSGRRFLTYLHRFVLCPMCGSQIRHRLVAAALGHHDVGRRTPLDGARLLHISPEYCLTQVFRSRARQYVAADWAAAQAGVCQDMTRMPYLDGAFDTVVSCDVLEHIPDDRLALAECRRVLRRGGMAILTVPQSDDLQSTVEDPSIDSPETRQRMYGQPDHVRNYGVDFQDRIEAAGFCVTCVDSRAFSPALARRWVLDPPFPLAASWGWNRRRVYFGEAI
jgi:SAM-dependent methyltransferase